MKQHRWRAPDQERGEPSESEVGSVCDDCLAYANSESHLPCDPENPAWEKIDG